MNRTTGHVLVTFTACFLNIDFNGDAKEGKWIFTNKYKYSFYLNNISYVVVY